MLGGKYPVVGGLRQPLSLHCVAMILSVKSWWKVRTAIIRLTNPYRYRLRERVPHWYHLGIIAYAQSFL
jgi:hypothetical protein